MWFKLASADFSGNNLGTLQEISQSYIMDYSDLIGLSASPSSVSYASDSTPDATITFTVKNGYVFKSGSTVTAFGGASKAYTASADIIAGSSFTMALTGITNKVTFAGAAELASGNGSIGGGGGTYTFTINPTPSTATVTLTASGYTQSGNSITVPNGTTVSWIVSASGYTEQNGTWTANGSNESKSVTLSTGSNADGVSNLLTLGTLHEQTVTESTTSNVLKTDSNYFTYANIPVSPNTNYISAGGRRMFQLNSAKQSLGASTNINNSTPPGSFKTLSTCAYVTISYKYADLQPDEAILTTA